MEEKITVQRDIGVITQEICEIKSRAQSLALMYAVEIGRRLIEAKAMLPHGEWGKWLAEKVDFTPRSAQNFMLAAKEFGDGESPSLLIFSNTKTFSHLPYTKVLQLLAIPEEEREEFVEKHDLSEMTSKEIAEAIKQRDEARKEAREAAKRAQEAEEAAKGVDALKKELADVVKAAAEAQKQLREAEKDVEAKVAAARSAAEKEAKEKAAKEALKLFDYKEQK